MDAAALHQALQSRFGDTIGALESGLEPAIRVAPPAIVAVCEHLKTVPALALDCLSNQSGVDYPKRNEIEVVYHLASYRLRHACVLKVGVPRDNPAMPTVSRVWSTAIWQEREIFDLLGVVFDGHPDLRRILMWDGFKDYPMRKDYVPPDDFEYEPTPHDEVLDRARKHYPAEAPS